MVQIFVPLVAIVPIIPCKHLGVLNQGTLLPFRDQAAILDPAFRLSRYARSERCQDALSKASCSSRASGALIETSFFVCLVGCLIDCLFVASQSWCSIGRSLADTAWALCALGIVDEFKKDFKAVLQASASCDFSTLRSDTAQIPWKTTFRMARSQCALE